MSTFFIQKCFAMHIPLLTGWICNILAKNIGTKAASKMLVKLTIGIRAWKRMRVRKRRKVLKRIRIRKQTKA